MIRRIHFLLTVFALLCGIIAPQTTAAQELNVEDSVKQAMALARAGKLAEAEEPLNRLLDQTNGKTIPKAKILLIRAYLRGENARFQEAATDLKQVIEIDPSDHIPWFLLMPLLVQTGDMGEYRNYSKGMLQRFGNSTNAPIAERTAKCFLLMPAAGSPDDLTQAAKVAEKAVALAKNGEWLHWRLMTRGLSEYRQGHFARAIKTMELAQKELTKAEDGAWNMCQADTYFVSAMAHHQLKQMDKASTAFGHGRVIVLTKLPSLDSKDLSPGWMDVLMTYILMHEAKTTIESATVAAIAPRGITSIPALAKDQPGFLGPANSGAESGFATWYSGVLGGGSVSIGNDDPATGYNYFRIGITNASAYGTNHADLRSEMFPLRLNRGPFTLSFAYKLPDTVKPGDNIDVDLRFFGEGKDNFLGQTVLNVGSSTGDSEMTQYKTMTATNILAPKGAVKADVWVVANIRGPWTSGFAQFDNFSVTATPARSRTGIFAGAGIFSALAACLAVTLFVRQRRRQMP
ncbi:tetratricopeptide repeat protein [Pedosphaera parvula]|uniref:Tetratricopeptide repeat protein n=1 Tax=Pedosphaera parvula (strain Ellin514) TaxID=320771 RepID=B9XBS9_PEDPL|nr:hypothetical protein [Pedosphaera parvula]EEF62964.1 hypothetical protein Cflav_PD5599 [Pedosphaera parvula Ellin514]